MVITYSTSGIKSASMVRDRHRQLNATHLPCVRYSTTIAFFVLPFDQYSTVNVNKYLSLLTAKKSRGFIPITLTFLRRPLPTLSLIKPTPAAEHIILIALRRYRHHCADRCRRSHYLDRVPPPLSPLRRTTPTCLLYLLCAAAAASIIYTERRLHHAYYNP